MKKNIIRFMKLGWNEAFYGHLSIHKNCDNFTVFLLHKISIPKYLFVCVCVLACLRVCECINHSRNRKK